jgi:molecular chaperone GrpE
VDNTENNLNLKSENTEENKSLDLHEEGNNVSSPIMESNETLNEEENPSDVDSSLSESNSTIDGGKTEVQEKTETESESIVSDDSVNGKIREDLQQEISKLKRQLTEQREQNQAEKSQYLRLVADFENFRRRTAKEKEDLEQKIKQKTINELLSVVDNFERARTQIKPANDGELAIHKSYQGVYKNLVDSLKKIGVSAMRPEGQPFDPNYHEAMLREATNEYPEGTVIEQLVRGYLLNDQVLRHAMVKVAAPLEGEESTSNSDSTAQSNDNQMQN